jgi:hypothetical protein
MLCRATWNTPMAGTLTCGLPIKHEGLHGVTETSSPRWGWDDRCAWR